MGANIAIRIFDATRILLNRWAYSPSARRQRPKDSSPYVAHDFASGIELNDLGLR